MEEAVSKPKKKVTFGKAYVRVLLNYNKDYDAEESTEEEMAITGRRRATTFPGSSLPPSRGNDSRQSKILDKKRQLKDLAQSPGKSEQVTQASEENPNEVRLKSILKKTAETYNDTDKIRRSRKSTALAFARWKTFKKADKELHSNERVEKNGPQTNRTRSNQTESAAGEKTSSREVRRNTMGAIIETTTDTKSSEGTTSSEVEKNQKRPQEMSVVLEQKRLETERRQLAELQKSKNENPNRQGQQLLSKYINTETSKENVGLKDENNLKPEETDKPKTTQVKDTGKWPGVKSLDPVKGLVSNTGVYSGVEADWEKTKESLSKFGVEVGEDKLQKPSEFIEIMNILLGLKRTAVTETNNNNVGAEKKENVVKPIREEPSMTEPPRDTPTLEYESLRTSYLDKVGKQNRTAESKKPSGTKGQLGERMKNIRKGFNVGEKVNGPKQRKHPGLKRSSSESSLGFVRTLETKEDPLRERCGSLDEMTGNSRRKDLKNADGKRRQKNAIAELLVRMKKKKKAKEYEENRNSGTQTERKFEELQERLDEELEYRMEKQSDSRSIASGSDSSARAELTQSEEESWVILDTPGKTKPDRTAGRTTLLEEANQIEDVSHVKETTHDAETSHVRKAIQAEKATQVEQTTQIEKATQVEEATQMKKATQVKEANQVAEANQMPDATPETTYVDKACQTKKRSRKKKSSRHKDVEKSTQIIANSVIKIREIGTVPAQLNPDTLFFKIMSTLPGHEVCAPN